MDFDIIIHKTFKETIKGNEIIVLIKSGQNGSMYGYQNKYLNIAKTSNEKYNYTVICSSNPFDGNNSLDDAIKVIEITLKKII